MLIPAQRPDAIEPPSLRREALPVSAPLPISGLPEQAQRADPRLAVQTVLPGFEGQAAIAPRRAPGLAQTPEQPEVAGTRAEPSARSEPSSLLQLSPRGEALTQWLTLATARRPLAVPVSWPEPDAQALAQAQTQAPAGPMRKLWALYLAHPPTCFASSGRSPNPSPVSKPATTPRFSAGCRRSRPRPSRRSMRPA